MKRVKGLAIGIAGVAATMMAASAMAGIQGSKHDLTSTSALNNNQQAGGTDEICVFCHTPHGTNTAIAVPLWNRLSDATPATTYTTYDDLGTATLDGTVLTVGSVSLACLSCHDGTQAMDSVINASGSGQWDPATGIDMGGTWSGPRVTAGGVLDGAATNVAYIGTDLRNDHPVGIQYAGGGVSVNNVEPTTSDFGDPDFKLVQHQTINGNNQWWVDVTGAVDGTRTRRDIILYTRVDTAGLNVDEPYVECASCHDPHETANATFLRVTNDASTLCLACHDK